VVLDPAYIGRTYPPSPAYDVGREKIREFADAIGDPNPAYRDRSVAAGLGHGDVIAPPTFPVIVTFAASRQIIDDPALGLDYSRVVHGEQRFVYSRPVRAGDQLVTTMTIENIRSTGGNDLLTSRAEVTAGGEHVVTAYSTLVARGTAG
jgi:acyl dehydratase